MTVQQLHDCFKEALLGGAQEVFETMMFMVVEEDADSEPIEGPGILGSITFKGHTEGVMTIACGMDCAKAIAMNMLGLPPGEELTDEEVQDAIGEVANMVMGTVKARVMEAVGDLQVSIPSVVMGQELDSSLGDRAQQVQLKVSIDDSTALLTLLYRESQNAD